MKVAINMEVFTCCTTCHYVATSGLYGTVSDPALHIQCCAYHKKFLPLTDVNAHRLVCRNFYPYRLGVCEEPELRFVAEYIPPGELWSYLVYYPAKKWLNIADLPDLTDDLMVLFDRIGLTQRMEPLKNQN